MGTLLDRSTEAKLRSAALAPEYFTLSGPARTHSWMGWGLVRLADGSKVWRWRRRFGIAIDIGRCGTERYE